MEKKLYRFKANGFRYGQLDGLFLAPEQAVDWLMGKTICFGESLGKYSEVWVKITRQNLFEIKVGGEVIQKMRAFLPLGYNPFDYVDDEEKEAVQMLLGYMEKAHAEI